MNYYELEQYPYSLIFDFVGQHRNVRLTSPMPAWEVREKGMYLNGDVQTPGAIDLFYIYDDDESPALGFRRIEPVVNLNDESYVNILLDPSLWHAWKQEMNRERCDWCGEVGVTADELQAVSKGDIDSETGQPESTEYVHYSCLVMYNPHLAETEKEDQDEI